MISSKHINKKFGRLKVLMDVTTDCNENECIALIGPNGSGKTTLIKSILGMVVPDSGTITVNGQNISKSYRYREQIGYMPQIGRYPDNMTIGHIFDMTIDIRRYEGKVLDEALMEGFALKSMFDKRMRTLSGGTRQKVSAALAFLFDPQALILDEPTAGLDPISSEILKEKILEEKAKGKLIIITSHILSELDDLVTHVIYMQGGKLQFKKEIEALREETGFYKLSKAIASLVTTNS